MSTTRLLSLLLASAMSFPLTAQTAEEAQRLHTQGRECFNSGRIAEGRALTKRAVDMRRQLFGEHHADYITSLNNYALSFEMEKNYGEAIRLQRRVMELCDSLNPPHPNWGLYTLNYGRFLYCDGKKQEAARVWEKALGRVEKFSQPYEYLLNALSAVYSEANDLKQMERIMALMEEHNENELKKPCNDAPCMVNKAQYYAAHGQTAEAKDFFLKALSMTMSDTLRATVTQQYAHLLYQTKEYGSAAEYMSTASQLSRRIYGKDDERPTNLMYQAGLYYFIGKHYEEAISCYRQVTDFYAAHPSAKNEKNKATCLYDMGNAYSGQRQHQKAKVCYAASVAYYAAHLPADSTNYAKAVLRLGIAEKFNGDYDESIVHHREAIALFEKLNKLQERNNAELSLRNCYIYAQRPVPADLRDDALKERTEAERMATLDRIINETLSNLSSTKKYLGQLSYAHSLSTLAGCYSLKQDYGDAVPRFEEYMKELRAGLRTSFRLQSANERMATWSGEHTSMQQIKDVLLTLSDSTSALRSQMAAATYDAALLSKGILLNSSIEFSKVLAAKGDASLTEAYAEARRNEATIARLRQTASSEEDLQRIVELTHQNQALLLNLYKGCAEFSDFTDYLSIDWQQVKQALQTGDVAVEFLVLGDLPLDEDKKMAALILTPDMQRPDVQIIGSLADMKAMQADSLLFSRTDNPLWGKLAHWMDGARRVFFSPDGTLAHIGIEYLPYNGRPLSEQKEVYRLSSTKEICLKRPAHQFASAALFGDINYNLGGTFTAHAQQAVGRLRDVVTDDDGTFLFSDLAHTRQEVEQIGQVMRKGRIKNVAPFIDTEASKRAFEALSGSKVDVIHIATHGLCLTSKGQSDAESMQRSSLAFAGANVDTTALLTAAEVAGMDLRHCELVTLSACETGLGKLGTDGVFGLQRGFKNAGVHTLLMSLRKVDDRATAHLMADFYRNLIVRRQSKREALVNAQRALREAGFTNPADWTSFILLDCL